LLQAFSFFAPPAGDFNILIVNYLHTIRKLSENTNKLIYNYLEAHSFLGKNFPFSIIYQINLCAMLLRS